MASEDEPDADSAAGGDDEHTRSQGIELGALEDELTAHDYPTTAGELVAEYGDYEIQLPGGEQTVEEVLGLYEDGDTDEEFGDADEVRQAIHNLVGAEAVGRDHYSDRGGSTPEVGDDDEDESF